MHLVEVNFNFFSSWNRFDRREAEKKLYLRVSKGLFHGRLILVGWWVGAGTNPWPSLKMINYGFLDLKKIQAMIRQFLYGLKYLLSL